MPERIGFVPPEEKGPENNKEEAQTQANPEAGQPDVNEVKKVVEVPVETELKPAAIQKIKLVDVRSKESHDAQNNMRYEALVDAPGKDKDKVYRRAFKFTVPETDRLQFLESRPKESLKFNSENLVDQYRKYRQEHYGQRERWMESDWLTDEQFRDQLKQWGYELGENQWETPAADSIEQVIARMLEQNKYDLQPRTVKLLTAASEKDAQMAFSLDGREFKVSFADVKTRAETALGLLKEITLPVIEKYRAMPFAEIKKITDENERTLAMQVLAIFAGIPSKALRQAQELLEKNSEEELAGQYQTAKASQDNVMRQAGRKSQLGQREQGLIFVFETLGLRLRSGNYSFATQAVQDALIKRLHREPWPKKERKNYLEEAKGFMEKLNLEKLGFKGLQAKLEKTPMDDRMREAVYIAAVLKCGYNSEGVVKDFERKQMVGSISTMDVNRTAARVAVELAQQRAKDKHFVDYSNRPYFDEKQDVVFRDPADKREGSFVARKRVQEGTGRQFVDVAIVKQVKKGEEQKKDRVFHLPFKDSSIIDSVQNAKSLRREVSLIFLERHQEGQNLSFVPYIELAKGRAKDNPKFKLTLGKTAAEVDYKSLYDSLDFKNKVEAELLKSTYLDNKKDPKFWDQAKDWQRQAVYRFQDIVSHSGLPSLTEQLIVGELLRRMKEQQTAAPVLSRTGKVVKTEAKKAKNEKAEIALKPTGSVSPSELRRIQGIGGSAEKAGLREKFAKKTATKKETATKKKTVEKKKK